jgi:hypothetical protein
LAINVRRDELIPILKKKATDGFTESRPRRGFPIQNPKSKIQNDLRSEV